MCGNRSENFVQNIEQEDEKNITFSSSLTQVEDISTQTIIDKTMFQYCSDPNIKMKIFNVRSSCSKNFDNDTILRVVSNQIIGKCLTKL